LAIAYQFVPPRSPESPRHAVAFVRGVDPVQAVNVVDLFRREHRQILIYTGRMPPEPRGCSLQDFGMDERTAGFPF